MNEDHIKIVIINTFLLMNVLFGITHYEPALLARQGLRTINFYQSHVIATTADSLALAYHSIIQSNCFVFTSYHFYHHIIISFNNEGDYE